MSYSMRREAYVATYGPTVGDRVRLADTNLFVEVERDLTIFGEEIVSGRGAVIRDGMGQSQVARSDGAVDTVIANALIVDHTGIIKADVGLKGGRIAGIGKAGNPDMQPKVSIIIGPGTDIVAGEGKILTAGAIDAHCTFSCPQQLYDGLLSGVTTMIGGGCGPGAGDGSNASVSGPWHLETMLRSVDDVPVNIGFAAVGSASDPAALVEQIKAGACTLSIGNIRGATPAAIDCCLNVSDAYDVQTTLQMESLNESGFLDDRLSALQERTFHSVHSYGFGGGQVPDRFGLCALSNVLPSTAVHTGPHSINLLEEQFGSLIGTFDAEQLQPLEDMRAKFARFGRLASGAEDVLHDMGALSMMTSGGHPKGRSAEIVSQVWQMAHSMKTQRGGLPEEEGCAHDNFRVKRYISKYTINPALAHGVTGHVGSVETGKFADLVLWSPAFFGVKPDVVIKGGVICGAVTSGRAGTVLARQPGHSRLMYGANRSLASATSSLFVSAAAIAQGIQHKLSLKKDLIAVEGVRSSLSKADMVFNDATPSVSVHPETGAVRANGELLESKAVRELPLAQRYFLF